MNMTNHLKAESWNFKRHPRCNFTIPKELEFVDRYKNGEVFSDMAKESGVSRNSLWKIVTKAYDVEPYQTSSYPKEYDLNTDVFNDIHNERSMYALGLIYSDGHISYGRLFFDTVDKEQLNNFRDCLETDKDYTTYPPEEDNHSEQYRFALKYQPMIEDLRKLVPDFSVNTTEINSKVVNSPYFNHFLRGFLDGDGSVGKTRAQITFIGNKSLMKSLGEAIEQNCNLKLSGLYEKTSGFAENAERTSCQLTYCKNKAKRKLQTELYDDATLFLTRKKQNLDSFLNN